MTTERDFQRAVMDLAELSGWETLHVRTSMQQGRYMTATTGTMAKGWPDLVLIHPKHRTLILVELKSERAGSASSRPASSTPWSQPASRSGYGGRKTGTPSNPH